MKENGLENNTPAIKWIRYSIPDISCEKGEAERVIDAVLSIKNSDPKFGDVLKSIGHKIMTGKLESLTDEMWAKLENTDSWSNVSEGDLKKAEELSLYYKKNFSGIMKAVKNSVGVPTPIIFKVGDRIHLMSGNTRLMVARGLKQQPKVIIVEYP